MKQIYSNFIGGLSYHERNVPTNTYNEGREVDPHRGLGYLKPGWAAATITKSNDATVIIDGLITDIVVAKATDDAYLCDDNHLYHCTNIASPAANFNSNFDGSSHYYYAITSSNFVDKLAIYGVSGTDYLLYAWRDVSGSPGGDVGIHTLGTTTFNDNYLSTDVGTGNAALQDDGSIDMMEWKTYMWISHGQYLGKFDGANDIWDATNLDLGEGWEITKLFPTENYIGICAWRKSLTSTQRAESRMFFYDGDADDWSFWRPIQTNKITNVFNLDGNITIAGFGRDLAATLSQLTETGSKRIKRFKVPISGTTINFDALTQNSMDNFGNRVLMGTSDVASGYTQIFSYGQDEEGQPKAFTMLWGGIKGASAYFGALKNVYSDEIWFSYKSDSVYYLSWATTGNSTNAYYKGNYTDMGQRIKINYVKFYFKPLVASDSVTVSIDTDYGISNSLGTISYAADDPDATGIITSKKFYPGPFCHAFRPVIDWSAGGVAFSKIVVDYDFISD